MQTKTPGQNLESIQAKNRALILRLLQRNVLCSRADLAKQSGLKQATITNMIHDYMDWGLVVETGNIEGNKGRRSIGIKLDEQRYFVISVRITREYFYVGTFTLLGHEVDESITEKIHGRMPGPVIDRIHTLISQLLDRHPERCYLAVGVAVPGPYYQKEGEIEAITDFPGWQKLAIRSEMQRGLALPVIVDHDANAGVLAECSFSINPDQYETVVYLAVGQGIGAGIFTNGKVFRGSMGIAGEIGHSSVNLDGPVCECGNHGCLTLYASTRAFAERMRKKYTRLGIDCDEDNVKLFQTLVQQVKAKDDRIYLEFRDIIRYLGTGIVNLIYAYNPSIIIIGDEMSQIGDVIVTELRRFLSRLTCRRIVDQVELRLTSFEKDPAYVGAAALAIDHTFRNIESFQEKFIHFA